MRRLNLPFIVVLVFILAVSLTAQTPQYYNANSGGIGNSIPFGSTGVNGYMAQYLMLANEFSQPSPAPAGNITKLYIYMSSTGGPATYSHLTIMMGQTTITVFPTGSQYTGPLDTVYHNASATLSSVANNWMMITLDEPFNYNPAQSLVIQISQCSFTGTGMSVWQTAGTTGVYRRNNLPGTPACTFTYSSQDSRILQCGVDIAPPSVMYYNYNTTGGANSFPFNQAAGKMIQTLIPPAGFSQPSPAPSGNIIEFSVMIAAGYPLGPATYTSFNILFGQTTLTSLPSGVFYSGTMDTVYKRASVTLTGTATTWMSFSLDHPFYYNPAQSLVVQIEQCGVTGTFSGFSLAHTSTSGINSRTYSVGGCPYVYGGTSTVVANCGVTITPTTGIDPITSQAGDYNLAQNYPNPFNPFTKISYAIPKSGFVTLKIFDMIGREIANLVNTEKQAGSYIIDFDASNLSSGVYFYRIDVNGFTAIKKMTVLK